MTEQIGHYVTQNLMYGAKDVELSYTMIKIMVIGGTTYDQENCKYIPTRTVEIYDLHTDRWTVFSQLSFDHAYIRTIMLNGQIICFSCNCLSGDNNNVIAEIFDPITETFQISRMFSKLIAESLIIWSG